MIAVTEKFKTVDHTDPEAFFGSIQNKMQHEKLGEFYSQISKKGWKKTLGGEPEPGTQEGKGFYIPATTIDNPLDDSSIRSR
jgi:acyl-CoA reductase-like NAD-dependent aldehyde dehydrogenase